MTSTLQAAHGRPKKVVFGSPKLHTDGELQLLAFAPDGTLLSVEEPGVLRRWNAETGQPLEWHALSDMETLWGFSRDARVLASASDDLTVWDASSGQMLTALPQESWVTAVAFQADPSFVVTGHDDGTIRVWDAAGHHLVFDRPLRIHKKPISALAVSPDGALLAAASEDKLISLWDLSDGHHVATLAGHTDRIPALAWHPDGNTLVSAGWDTTARVWDVKSGQPVMLLNSHATQVTAVAFSPDGRRLASADSGLAVHVWDFDAKKTLHVLKGPLAEVRALAFSPDGRRLACNGERMIHVWDATTGSPLIGAGPRPVSRTTLAVSPDGTRLVSNGGGTAARVWDVATRQPVVTLPSEEPVHAVAYSPDGRLIAGACGDRVRVWDAATGAHVADWDGPEEPITDLVFSPDGTTLASSSNAGLAVWLWRVSDGEPILLIPDALDNCAVQALAFHPAGQLLAAGGIDWLATGGSNGAASLWNLPERYEAAVFLGGTTAVAFHPTGDRLATTSLDGSVCVWGVADQELQAELTGHEGQVNCLAYTPDGRLLASGAEDATIRLWDEHGHEVAALELESVPTALAFAPDGTALFVAHANTTCSLVPLADVLPQP